jgi:plastocyanin
MSRKTLSLSGALTLIATIASVPTIALAGSHDRTTPPRAHAAATHTVSLSGFSFHPSTLTIRRGDSVRWSWSIPKSEHNVTFRSVRSRTGSSGSLTVRFPHPGTFSYICTVHVNKGMKGKVVVR